MGKYTVIALLVLALTGGVLLYQQNRQLTGQLAAVQARMSAWMQQPGAGDNGKQQADPYLAGAVKNTILKQYSAIGVIYKRYLATHPQKADGKVKVDWQIAPDGQVIEPGLIFSELDAGSLMEQALPAAIAHWRFPPPPSGINRYVAHTFVFREHPMTEEEKASARQSIVDSLVTQQK